MPIITKGGKIMDKNNNKQTLLLSNVIASLVKLDKNKENTKDTPDKKFDMSENKILLSNLKKVGSSKDPSIIINTERLLIQDKIASHKKNNTYNKGTNTSLSNSLNDLNKSLISLNDVYDKDYYRRLDTTLSDQKRDKTDGLPIDRVHRFINSNITRINNAIIASEDPNYKRDILTQRVTNMKTAKNEYKKLQAKALDINLPERSKSKERERD